LFGRLHRAQSVTLLWLAYRIGVVNSVEPDGAIQHIFLQKWCNFTCLSVWASEGFFPGGPPVDFSKFFSRGLKVVKFGFYPSKLRKQLFLLKIPVTLPTPMLVRRK